MPESQCPTCGETKSREEFYYNRVLDRWFTECKPCHKERSWGNALPFRYGLTPEQYWELYEAQNGLCAICFMPDAGQNWTRRLAVDHDHETGRVRGLLCSSCNTNVGWHENKEWIASVRSYLGEDNDSRNRE